MTIFLILPKSWSRLPPLPPLLRFHTSRSPWTMFLVAQIRSFIFVTYLDQVTSKVTEKLHVHANIVEKWSFHSSSHAICIKSRDFPQDCMMHAWIRANFDETHAFAHVNVEICMHTVEKSEFLHEIHRNVSKIDWKLVMHACFVEILVRSCMYASIFTSSSTQTCEMSILIDDHHQFCEISTIFGRQHSSLVA